MHLPVQDAGMALAELARRLLDDEVTDRPIVVLAGRGAHGGCSLAAAHELLTWGAWVQVVLAYARSSYRGWPAQQLGALQRLGVPLAFAEEGWELPPADLIIDALIDPWAAEARPLYRKVRNLIQLANSSAAPILSLGAPSGLQLATGVLSQPHIRAAATLLLQPPTATLLDTPGRDVCGELFVADTSVPPVAAAVRRRNPAHESA